MEFYNFYSFEDQCLFNTFDFESRYFGSLDRLEEVFQESFARYYSYLNPEKRPISQRVCWDTDNFDNSKDEFLSDEDILRNEKVLHLPIGTKPKKVVPPPPQPIVKKPKPFELQKPMEIGYWFGVPMTPKSILKKRNNHRRNGRYQRRSNRYKKSEKPKRNVSFKEEVTIIKSKF